MAPMAMAPSKPVQIYDPAATITIDWLINASDTDDKCPASIHGSVGQDNYEPVIRIAFNKITLFTLITL